MNLMADFTFIEPRKKDLIYHTSSNSNANNIERSEIRQVRLPAKGNFVFWRIRLLNTAARLEGVGESTNNFSL